MKFNIKNTKKGLSLFSQRAFSRNEQIAIISGKIINYPTDYTYPISLNTYIEPRGYSDLEYLCHSCKPNVAIKKNTNIIYALKDISIGDELLIDYATFCISVGFLEKTKNGKSPHQIDTQCLCESELCRGNIIGFSQLQKEEKELLIKNDRISDYLVSLK